MGASEQAKPLVHSPVADPDSEVTRMLGAQVDANLYWSFKQAAALRKEDLKVAIAHAARMYIDADKTVPEE